MSRSLDYINDIVHSTSNFCKSQKVLFSCLLAERQINFYYDLSKNTTNLDYEGLRSELDLCWDWLINKNTNSIIQPDFERFFAQDNANHYGAFEPVVTILSILQYISDSGENIVNVVVSNAITSLENLIYDSLDLEIDSINELVVIDHRLFKVEIVRQRDDLKLVTKFVFNENNIDRVKQTAQTQSLLLDFSIDKGQLI